MKVERKLITIAELVEGYSDDGEGGVLGYNGNLDIRPPYQREFVYKAKQRNDVIRSVLAGFPLNVMYWANRPDGRHEVLDGQQRTISIGQYVDGEFSIDDRYFSNQPIDVQKRIKNYELTIYLCDGELSERLEWFRIVNIAGAALTDQELRNAVYSGPWVTDAKRYFSSRGCAAKAISEGYLKGNPIRQELLETAIKWASDHNIDDFMARNQHNESADNLWAYFQSVITWVEGTFPIKRAQVMQGVDWGKLHMVHKDEELDPDALEREIKKLLSLETSTQKNVIQKPQGVYPYVLDGDERHLNLRSFSI